MKFPQPLARGRLVQRYKRFFADVALDDGTHVTAHCPNPGAMLGPSTPGLPVWVSRSDDPKRKLAYTLELVEAGGGLVGVNTMHPNRLVAEALAEGAIPELAGYAFVDREPRLEDGRCDFRLRAPDTAWVEVKNATMREDRRAIFPDCVSDRATRHVDALARRVAAGDSHTVSPGSFSPSMAPGLGTWAVSARPSSNSTSARKRL